MPSITPDPPSHVATLPAPSGWFSVGVAAQLERGAVWTLRLAGHEIVVFRSQRGEACAVDAYCPHMGAHIGHGGTVVGESVRCPFHGFCFDKRGTCVATGSGYGPRLPKKARMRAWPVHEVNGLLMVYNDSEGRTPAWSVPALDEHGWTPLRTTSFRLRGHPQETTENSVDIRHLAVVHGYHDVETRSELTLDGPRLRAAYAMRRPFRAMGRQFGAGIRAEFDVQVHGLGYSLVDVRVNALGLWTRQFVLATPTEPGQIELRIGVSTRMDPDRARVHPMLRAAPAAVRDRLIPRLLLSEFAVDVGQDFEIWSNKRHLTRPALAEGDGPVGAYRRWTRQFYTDTPAPEVPAESG